MATVAAVVAPAGVVRECVESCTLLSCILDILMCGERTVAMAGSLGRIVGAHHAAFKRAYDIFMVKQK